MGECNYYFKARFAYEGQAKAAEPRLAELLVECEKANSFWQGSSRFSGRADPNWMPLTVETFRRIFRERFPLTVLYLGELAGMEEWCSGLAVNLSLVDPQTPPGRRPRAILRRIDTLLLLQLNPIWHNMSLRLLEQYCRGELGALDADGVSEEAVAELYEGRDPFGTIKV